MHEKLENDPLSVFQMLLGPFWSGMSGNIFFYYQNWVLINRNLFFFCEQSFKIVPFTRLGMHPCTYRKSNHHVFEWWSVAKGCVLLSGTFSEQSLVWLASLFFPLLPFSPYSVSIPLSLSPSVLIASLTPASIVELSSELRFIQHIQLWESEKNTRSLKANAAINSQPPFNFLCLCINGFCLQDSDRKQTVAPLISEGVHRGTFSICDTFRTRGMKEDNLQEDV